MFCVRDTNPAKLPLSLNLKTLVRASTRTTAASVSAGGIQDKFSVRLTNPMKLPLNLSLNL